MSSSTSNQRIMDKLSHIAEAYRSQGIVHKYHAYRNAIDTVKAFGRPIDSAASLKGLKGIGKAMLDKIDEILKTGELHQEQQVLADPETTAMKLFTTVHGVGPSLARKLVYDHKLRSLEDLENCDGVHLPPAVRLGLKHYEHSQERIPFDEVEDHRVFILDVAKQIDRRLQIEICGSHRRGAALSGDIDLLLTHRASRLDSGADYMYLKLVIAAMRDNGYVVDSLAEGNSKFMGYCCLPKISKTVRRLDVRWFTYDCFFPALLYFTGSDMFNVNLRVSALKIGLTINEYGVYRVKNYDVTRDSPTKKVVGAAAGIEKGEKIEILSEEEIFKLVGLEFVEPRNR